MLTDNILLGGRTMLISGIAQLPSYISNMAQGALKRVSATLGYNTTCMSQDAVMKQLPETDTSLPAERVLSRRNVSHFDDKSESVNADTEAYPLKPVQGLPISNLPLTRFRNHNPLPDKSSGIESAISSGCLNRAWW